LSNTEISPEVNAKIKRNLIVIFIFAVVMIFAGLTSGYIVSQGGNFWVNVKMPSAFQFSTIIIIVSSIFLIGALFAVKKGKQGLMKILLGLSLICGILFGVYQVKGGYQLVENGNAWNGQIINIKGQYGKYFSFAYQGKEISFDNGTFYLRGAELKPDLKEKLKEICKELVEGSKANQPKYTLPNYGMEFSLRYQGQALTYADKTLLLNGHPLAIEQHSRLRYFAESILADRGDFIMKGKYGEDFVIYYKGKALDYENRSFSINGQPLSPKQLNDLNSQDNKASSYIYAFAFMHYLHWIGGVIALLVIFIQGVRSKYSASNYLGIKLGSIYWHFLGILWLYLYAFLIFIH
jgi:cytochrome c oxidase subunit 3